MRSLSESQVLEHIDSETAFEAKVNRYILRVKEYVPYVCTALHNGHQLREELVPHCLLSDEERLFEEDPYTEELISSMPIALVALDSRYEYDLNRPIAQCVYKEAWGKQVWKKDLGPSELEITHEKYHSFYRIFQALITKLENKFNACVVYDIHSYNYHRLGDIESPTFNIGTSQINVNRWKNEILHFVKRLRAVQLPNIEVSVAKDKVFQGKGYLATFIQKNFDNTLILSTEVKKIYIDEETGEVFPIVLFELKSHLTEAISSNAAYFARRNTTKRYVRKEEILPSNIESIVKRVDFDLFHIARGVETLLYVNPINLQQEKRRFFSKKYEYSPVFIYRQLDIDPYQFREKLYRLPVDEFQDVTLQFLYRKVIDAYAMKIDLLTTIGTDQFIYNSLKYYGEPEPKDVENAKFILYASDLKEQEEEVYDAVEAKQAFQEALNDYGIKCRIEISAKILAGAMVNNVRKAILINKKEKWSQKELSALIHHELGVHMVTTVNANLQPLKIFKLGLPGNTYTQEGLAILSEYLSGNLTLSRLKILALRVLAVDMLVKRYTFSQTFEFLMNTYRLERDSAFNIVSRVYRGGGFTKDYLYLKGLQDACFFLKNHDITNIYVGKTSFDFLDLINELISRKILLPPQYLPISLSMNLKPDLILNYIIDSIR